MKKLLSFIDGKEPSDKFTKELEEAVKTIRDNEKWRLDYMTLQMSYQEKYEQGRVKGTIETLKSIGYSEEKIIEHIMSQFGMSEKEACECLKEKYNKYS